MRNPVEEFERQYRARPDPWGLATSHYERERYATSLGVLEPRYGRVLEVGAAIGVLSERLAQRGDALVTLEPAPTALAQARARLAGLAHVTVLAGSAPEDLPAGPFDLIVCSEVLYYFSPDALEAVLTALAARLDRDGALLAVHWRGLGTHQQTGAAVHRQLRARFPARRRIDRPGYVLDLLGAPQDGAHA